MKVLFAFCALFLFISSPHAARADETRVDPAFVRPLMNWIERHTGTRVATLPEVVVSSDKLSRYGGEHAWQGGRKRALYVPGLVVLDEYFWDQDNVRTVSFLVHELAHHAQTSSGKIYPCHTAKEYEAYTLQNAWLVAQGVSPVIPRQWIEKMAACAGRDRFHS
jgi:hypothetical protein